MGSLSRCYTRADNDVISTGSSPSSSYTDGHRSNDNQFPTMMPRLPLEVLERIIDDVVKYNDDLTIDNLSSNWTSIKACALVCHSFLPPCRKHIFAAVTLNARNSSSPTSDDLNHLLSNSPHLAVYIRKLYYLVNKKDFAAHRSQWLLSMFKKLVKLRKLSIGYFPSLRKIRLDVIWTKGSPTPPPSSNSHQYPSGHNLQLCFSRFGKLCQSKKIADSVFRVLEWCWEIFGGITRHTGDA